MSRGILGKIAAVWDKKQGGMFRSRLANLLAKWCLEHWEKYKEPPRKSIQVYYDLWAQRHQRDEATITLIERLLSSLSEQFEMEDEAGTLSEDYVLSLAEKQFNAVKLLRTVESVQNLLEMGEVEIANETMEDHRRIAFAGTQGVHLINDRNAIQEAFEESHEDLINYPGALGEFFAGEFVRDAFVSFMAPEKRGKTWWLIDVALQAVKARRRVAFFSAGDLTDMQMRRRIAIAVSGHPRRAKAIQYPLDFEFVEGAGFLAKFAERHYDSDLTWRTAARSFDKLLRRYVRSRDPYFKLLTVPAGTLSVDDMRNHLSKWDESLWTPDVIVVDYADILCPKRGLSDTRERINSTWMDLRALSQERKALVVTATQADAKSYGSYLLTRSNFSDDKRKLAHVTAMIGINQTLVEKKHGIFRLNQILSREGTLTENDQVVVAGCLDIGRPAIKNMWDNSWRERQANKETA